MILVLNCGSQSIKWKVFNLPRGKAGDKLKVAKEGKREVLDLNDFEKILEEEILKLKDFEISKIGHRVVHGKNIFFEPAKITEEKLKKLETLNSAAPLHNPFNVLGIKICQKIFTNTPNIAVFDTEFYKNLPEKAFVYALPEELAEKFGFRKYGFHGISHEYVASTAAKAMADKKKSQKIISVHLGGGSSITAIKNGKAIDTSMGFSPLSGLVMMTRPGDVDDEIIFEIIKELGPERAKEVLNKESGMKGICGEDSMLKILDKLKAGDKKAKLALDVFVYQIQKYIGSYFAILGGCDLLVFTGAIGFGSSKIRNMICKDLKILNPSARLKAGTKIFAIKTDEELAIANKIKNLKLQ